MGLFEAADGLADAFPQFRQPPGAEEQQDDDQDDDNGSQIITKHGAPLGFLLKYSSIYGKNKSP
jgi:hypothetical protein